MLHQAEAEKATADIELEVLTGLQRSAISQAQGKREPAENTQFKDLNLKAEAKQVAKKYQITDMFSLKAALAKKQEFVEMLQSSLDELTNMELDCKQLNEVMSKDPSVPDQGR